MLSHDLCTGIIILMTRTLSYSTGALRRLAPFLVSLSLRVSTNSDDQNSVNHNTHYDISSACLLRI